MAGGVTFTEAQCIKANTLPRSYIEAMDWHTVLYTHVILYGSAQQVNLSACNDWKGQIRRHFFTPCQCPKLYQPPCNTCTITVRYVWWLCNHREVKHYSRVPYKWDRLEQKMASIWKFFRPSHSERFACCTLTIRPKNFQIDAIFCSSLSHLYGTLPYSPASCDPPSRLYW